MSVGSCAEDHNLARNRCSNREGPSSITMRNPGLFLENSLQDRAAPLMSEPIASPVSWLHYVITRSSTRSVRKRSGLARNSMQSPSRSWAAVGRNCSARLARSIMRLANCSFVFAVFAVAS